ncbi:lytic polysaccharide monooxygenase auxiliary activity family 9 protein [Micromonospora endolithica]|uniref:Chitin-binding protein n=1 Tax=Micromonospora endolithica TaxID=230091 RepID=A0A3A9YZ93_9ACTN|nr:lytic polysaccharide monooxygenase [Micromonospora endolithica]RKN41059.1 chitin-binding protein [Micromonospora endolithica]
MKRRTLAVASALAVLAAAATAVVAAPQPAYAHGAMTSPATRTWACYLEGPESPLSNACRDAVAQGGTQPLYDWYGVLIGNNAGRHRELIPDGQLCGAGTAKYTAYDAARADWPATTLEAGADHRFTYAAWAPHPGTFEVYVTRDGYDPTKPLAWSDLEPAPFTTVTNPSIVDGAYQWDAVLPADKTGRHVLYSVWQRSDSPEAFFNCSDVVFGFDGGGGPGTDGKCSATVTVDQRWPGGFQASVTVRNDGPASVRPWSVGWHMYDGAVIGSGWNAVVSQTGHMARADAPSWNETLAPGSAVTIGFIAAGEPADPPIATPFLNGVACG